VTHFDNGDQSPITVTNSVLLIFSVRTTSLILLQTAPTHIHVENLKEKILTHVSSKTPCKVV